MASELKTIGQLAGMAPFFGQATQPPVVRQATQPQNSLRKVLVEIVLYIFIGLCVVGTIAWWISVFYALGVAAKQETAEGTLSWFQGAIWSFFAACLLIGLLRGCQ